MKTEKKKKSKDTFVGRVTSTESVHAGELHGRYCDSLTEPVVLTSTYIFKTAEDIEAYTSGKKRHFEYGRYGNPTQQTAEKKLSVLEGAEACLLFDSGMSAVTATLLTFLHRGLHMIATDDSYKKTLLFCEKWLPRFGIRRTIVKMGDYSSLAKTINDKTKVILVESPTNPYLNIFDFQFIKTIKKEHPNVIVVVDGTFGTPYNQRPLENGADIVIHSATKYLGGHNDIMGGAVLGSSHLIDKVAETQHTMGGIIDPFSSYLLIRGLKTFAIRMERQNHAGLEIAKYLEKHPKVGKVFYPGLESHSHHSIAKRQMKGFGGVVTFMIDGEPDRVKCFLNSLKLCLLAPSLGGTETLVCHPASMSYYNCSRKERQRLGISDGLIRLSLGVEDVEDIKNDLYAALERV